MAFKDVLQRSYEHAKSLRPGLRKGQFMQETIGQKWDEELGRDIDIYHSGKYKKGTKEYAQAAEASARRQYNKIVSGESSGERVQKRVKERYRRVGPAGHTAPRLGGGERGLWKVLITFYYVSQETGKVNYSEFYEPYPKTRSFVAVSAIYHSILDKPALVAILNDAVEVHIEDWTNPAQPSEHEEGTTDPIAGWVEHSIPEVFMIQRTDLPEERIVHIDDIIIEDGY